MQAYIHIAGYTDTYRLMRAPKPGWALQGVSGASGSAIRLEVCGLVWQEGGEALDQDRVP